MKTTNEAMMIIQALLDALDYAESYAQNKDGFSVFNNDTVDAYCDAEQFIKRVSDEN